MKKLKEATVSTLYIIGLFGLITIGLPLFTKDPYTQTFFYGGLAVITGRIIGGKNESN